MEKGVPSDLVTQSFYADAISADETKPLLNPEYIYKVIKNSIQSIPCFNSHLGFTTADGKNLYDIFQCKLRS